MDRKKTLQFKMMMYTFWILLASIPAILLLNYFLIKAVVPIKSDELYSTLIDRIEQNIVFVLQTSDYTYEKMSTNQPFMQALNDQTDDAELMAESKDLICRKMMEFSRINAAYISDLCILTEGKIYSSSTNFFADIAETSKFQIDISARKADPVSLIQFSQEVQGLKGNLQYLDGKFAILRKLYDTKGNPLAEVLMVLKDSVIEKLVQYSNIAIHDNQGNELFSNLPFDSEVPISAEQSGEFAARSLYFDGQFYSVNTVRSETYGWRITNFVPMYWYKSVLVDSLIGTLLIASIALGIIMLAVFSFFRTFNDKIDTVVRGFSGAVSGAVQKISLKENKTGNGKSFTKKLTAYFSGFICLYLCVTCMVSYNLIDQKLNEHNEKLLEEIVMLDRQNTENFLYNYNHVVNFLSSSSSIKNFLYNHSTASELSNTDYEEMYYDIINTVSNVKNSPMGVKLVDMKGNVLYQNSNMPNIVRPGQLTPRISPTWGLVTAHGVPYFYVSEHCYRVEKPAMSLGECDVIIPVSNLYEVLGGEGNQLSYKLMPLNTPQKSVGQWSIPLNVENAEIRLFYNAGSSKLSDLILLIVYAVYILAATFLVFKLNRKITARLTKPIFALNGLYEEIEKMNLSVRYSEVYGDELDMLVQGFNRMVDRLNQLIEEVYKTQLKEKQLEYDVLIGQINPHFLYNSLETINSMVDIHDPRTTKMITLLSVFFRKGLAHKGNLISLRDEFEYTRVYTDILQMRFGESIRFLFPEDEQLCDCEGCKTVKLVLQPLIENSIKHGLHYRGNGVIRVAIERSDNGLRLIVEDDGIGMNAERLSQVRQKLTGEETADGIGFVNVHNRIVLQFGKEYGLTVDSEEQRGTRVTVRLPRTN